MHIEAHALGGRDGTGRDAFKTRTHTSESGGKKQLDISTTVKANIEKNVTIRANKYIK